MCVCDRKSVCPLGSNVVGKLWTAWNARASISRSIPSVVSCVVMCSNVVFFSCFSFSSVRCRFSFGYDHFTHIFMDNIVQCLPALFRIVCRIVVHGPVQRLKLYCGADVILLGHWERIESHSLVRCDHMFGWRLESSMHTYCIVFFVRMYFCLLKRR